MIDNRLLKTIESKFNSSPCKYCGLQHKVRIEQVSSFDESECNKADCTIPRGDTTITINLDDEACLAAQTEINLIVSRETAKYYPL